MKYPIILGGIEDIHISLRDRNLGLWEIYGKPPVRMKFVCHARKNPRKSQYYCFLISVVLKSKSSSTEIKYQQYWLLGSVGLEF